VSLLTMRASLLAGPMVAIILVLLNRSYSPPVRKEKV
jgi:hypothetical protein